MAILEPILEVASRDLTIGGWAVEEEAVEEEAVEEEAVEGEAVEGATSALTDGPPLKATEQTRTRYRV